MVNCFWNICYELVLKIWNWNFWDSNQEWLRDQCSGAQALSSWPVSLLTRRNLWLLTRRNLSLFMRRNLSLLTRKNLSLLTRCFNFGPRWPGGMCLLQILACSLKSRKWVKFNPSKSDTLRGALPNYHWLTVIDDGRPPTQTLALITLDSIKKAAGHKNGARQCEQASRQLN